MNKTFILDLGDGRTVQIPLNMAHMVGGINLNQLSQLQAGESAPVQLSMNNVNVTGTPAEG